MLTYLAQEFRTAATVENDGRRYAAYAELLDRIACDLLTDDERGTAAAQKAVPAY